MRMLAECKLEGAFVGTSEKKLDPVDCVMFICCMACLFVVEDCLIKVRGESRDLPSDKYKYGF